MKILTKYLMISVIVTFFVACGGGSTSNKTPDSAILVSNTLPTSLDSNQTKSGSLVVKAVSSTSVDYIIKYDSNSSVAKSGSFGFVSQNASGEYTFSLEINGTELKDGNFTLSSTFPSAGTDLDFSHQFTVNNLAPTWTQSSYNTGLTITDRTDAAQTIQDLTTISSDPEGDPITYSIVSVSVPSDQAAWDNSVVINSGVLQVQNLMTNDPNTSGTVTVTVKATSSGGSATTTISFTFNDVQ